MVDIECTRCGATGTGYPTLYVAKFSLTHEEKCGARVGVPKYSNIDVTTVPSTSDSVVQTIVETDKPKPKKKKSSPKKKKVKEMMTTQ